MAHSSDDLTTQELLDLWPRDIKGQLDKRVAVAGLRYRSELFDLIHDDDRRLLEEIASTSHTRETPRKPVKLSRRRS